MRLHVILWSKYSGTSFNGHCNEQPLFNGHYICHNYIMNMYDTSLLRRLMLVPKCRGSTVEATTIAVRSIIIQGYKKGAFLDTEV